jgi:hypothetical protein
MSMAAQSSEADGPIEAAVCGADFATLTLPRRFWIPGAARLQRDNGCSTFKNHDTSTKSQPDHGE